MVKFWITLLFLTSFLGYTSQLIIKSSNRDHIKPSNVGRIINGRNASITEVPYLVQILDHPNALPICGGILIAPTKVITSAHCVYDDDKKSFEERLYIRYGTSLSLWSLFPVIPVSRIVVHRNYDWINQGQENDIAILILKEKILQKNGIEYARLPTYEFDGEFFVSIYGWGDVAEGGPSSYILLKTTMKTMTTSDCVKRGNRGCLSENECKIICATSDDTGGGDGDSGGPVVFPDGTVVGIYTEKIYTNYSMDEEEPWQERIFLRTFSYRNFISFHELRHFQKWLDTNNSIVEF